ncbi:MAG: prepilin-type N-terminal cleavage/methylation domain-containing protein [Methylobacter sp.]|nr:prepilin-type N-terminal cleavage/methylation domain-containing protein [Methylobacter sp.]
MIRYKYQGFTLIELIMVIVIVGILATITTKIITFPVSSYLDLQRRTTLVDTAELALRLMQRDIRRSLPNSVRITGGGTVIELLHVEEGGRYRAGLDINAAATAGLCSSNPAGDILDFTLADNCFEVIGNLKVFNPQATAGESLVIYNLGNLSADAYAGSNQTKMINSSNAKVINFNTFRFPFNSPQQRFFIIDTPVTYLCTNNQLLRYSGYAISATQPNPPTGVIGQLQANKIASCSFIYDPGTAARSGLVTIKITLTDTVGESVQLMQQIHVDNVP